jgi:hypothetical protein
MFTVGKIIGWNPDTQRGLIEHALTGNILRFDYGHQLDRHAFTEGMRVTFETVGTAKGLEAVNVECASAAFSRLASVYDPDANVHLLVNL